MTVAEVVRNNGSWAYECQEVLAFAKTLPKNCIHTIITSPPYYGLRDYGVDGQIGLEESPDEFIAKLVDVFRALREALHPSGTLFLNMGDSYANDSKWGGSTGGNRSVELHGKSGVGRGKRKTGMKGKDLMGIPWMLAFALRADGWYLRSDIIWDKPNAMPESIPDRPSKSHEYIFMLTKSPRYFYDCDAGRMPYKPDTHKRQKYGWSSTGDRLQQHQPTRAKRKDKEPGYDKLNEGGANLRTVWSIPVGRYKYAHFATFPKRLPQRCIRLGTSAKGCCPTCLEPWRRVVVKKRVATRPGSDSKVNGGPNSRMRASKDPRHAEEANGKPGRKLTKLAESHAHRPDINPDKNWQTSTLGSMATGNRDPQRHCTVRTTTGWKPSCECPPADPIPCLVLDPFVGSGTTIAVAVEEGRRAIGCELNPDYCKFIDRRMRTIVPDLFATV